jgi:hypothetical protein
MTSVGPSLVTTPLSFVLLRQHLRLARGPLTSLATLGASLNAIKQ